MLLFVLIVLLQLVFLDPVELATSATTILANITTTTPANITVTIPANNTATTVWYDPILDLMPLISVVVAGGMTIFFAPYVKGKFSLRQDFFVGYKKWCTTLNGELREYEFMVNRLKNWDKDDLKLKDNSTYILIHFWELHNCISEGHKYLGKVHKLTHWHIFRWRVKNEHNHNIYWCLLNFVNYIDASWHELEGNYHGKLDKPSSTEKELKCIISNIQEKEVMDMAEDIKKSINKLEEKLKLCFPYEDPSDLDKNPCDPNSINKPTTKITEIRRFLEREIP